MEEILKNWPFVISTLTFAAWLVKLHQKILEIERQVNSDRHEFKSIFEKIDVKIDKMSENIVQLKIDLAHKGGNHAER
jgi:hypothetical protein